MEHSIKFLEGDDISKNVTELLMSDKPVWLSRYGGSDSFFIEQYKTYNTISDHCYKIIKLYNGFFNKDDNIDITLKYIDMYINSIKEADLISICCIMELINDKICTPAQSLILDNKLCISYGFFESITPFLNSFKVWGQGKKILIISPFAESLKFQTQPDRINNILNNYEFPDCTFCFYDMPITYNSPDFENSIFNDIQSNYDNFFVLADKIFEDIKTMDFDIAFLSCASYSMYFGHKIKTELNKKAIYIGGILNVLFNIYGKRYDNSFYDQFINKEYQIEPLENKKYLKDTNDGKQFVSEGLNAYFGFKKL